MYNNDHFSRIRRRFALEAKRVQFRARQSQFFFSLFHDNGALRYTSRATIAISLFMTVSSMIYYVFLYSTRYQSEIQFSIQNAELFHSLGKGSQQRSAPDLMLVQNTQIAYEYLSSYDLFIAFMRERRFGEVYSAQKIDILSRFSFAWSEERQFDFWKDLIDKKIQLPGGLIKIRFIAFDPVLANELNLFIVSKLSERLNSVNKNIFTSLTETNYRQLKASQDLYINAISDLSAGRQTLGQIEPLKWAEDIIKVITDINTTLLLSKSELSALNQQKLGNSPQAEILKRRLIELNSELGNLKNLLTKIEYNSDSFSVAEAARVTSFLELKKSISEKLVEISVENYEVSKQLAELTRSFVQIFVDANIVSITSYIDRIFLGIAVSLSSLFVGILLLYLVNFLQVRL